MLVLSRHRGERIIIGDDIVITLIDIYKDSVRLGIDAPVAVPVHRSEVAERIERERRERQAPQCPDCGLYYMPGDHHECPEIGAHSKITWPWIERERRERDGLDVSTG
jgi:carbon storage regulator